MLLLLALTPLALLLVLLIGLRWSASAAASLSAAAAGVITVGAFGYGKTNPASAMLGPFAEAGFSTATILWIIFGALWLHQYQLNTGAVGQIGRWLRSFNDDRGTTAILVAWFFALFLEGAAGFGTPVALAAPLLVGLGFPPVKALVLVLLGHSAGVSFGAVGTPMMALMHIAGTSSTKLPLAVAMLHALLGWTLLILVTRRASQHRPDGSLAGWRWSLLAAAGFFVPYVLVAWAIGPELPTLLGALAGAALFLALNRSLTAARRPGEQGRGLWSAASPYVLVIALIVLTRLVEPLREALQSITLSWRFVDGFSGSAVPLYHPGTLLVAGLLLAATFGGGTRQLASAAVTTAQRLPKVAVGLFAVLLLARVSLHSGMIAAIADAAAGGAGRHWLLASPVVGALGSFVTGSATASNLLFGEFQLAAAAHAGASPLLVLAGQGFGAAAGNMIAPHNILAGAATVGLVGAEGRVVRQTIVPCILYVLAGGVLLWLVS